MFKKDDFTKSKMPVKRNSCANVVNVVTMQVMIYFHLMIERCCKKKVNDLRSRQTQQHTPNLVHVESSEMDIALVLSAEGREVEIAKNKALP
jgi:hypothetical protein